MSNPPRMSNPPIILQTLEALDGALTCGGLRFIRGR